MWEFSFKIFASVFIALGLIWSISYLLISDEIIYISKGKKRHNWKFIKIIDRGGYCSICKILLQPSNGLFCDWCGIHSHVLCARTSDQQFRCKTAVLNNDIDTIKHHWVKGNLPPNSECFLCNEDIDYHLQPGLYGQRCCWCNRCAHNKCFSKIISDDVCDFGEFNEMIIPPYNIILSRTKSTPFLHLQKIRIDNLKTENWKPLIVIANVKSGCSSASKIISLFRGILNPLQVMELSSQGPLDALQWVIKALPATSRILIAGGDGTVGWILNTIEKIKIYPIPEVAILPLGTGNDLSRILNWGAKPPSDLDPFDILRKIQNSEAVYLDRWLLEIKESPYRFPIKRKKMKSIFLYNYFSIGVDAQVTLNFHKARESSFYILSSRIINKLLYLCFGTHQVMQPDCVGLEKHIELFLDGEFIDLPELQSLVFLNIDSWGAGVKLWAMSSTLNDERTHSISDGKLEVLGVTSSFHIAQLQVGLSRPTRFGQAKQIKLIMHNTYPVQADGEPWTQKPSEINLKVVNQAKMLKFNEN